MMMMMMMMRIISWSCDSGFQQVPALAFAALTPLTLPLKVVVVRQRRRRRRRRRQKRGGDGGGGGGGGAGGGGRGGADGQPEIVLLEAGHCLLERDVIGWGIASEGGMGRAACNAQLVRVVVIGVPHVLETQHDRHRRRRGRGDGGVVVVQRTTTTTTTRRTHRTARSLPRGHCGRGGGGSFSFERFQAALRQCGSAQIDGDQLFGLVGEKDGCIGEVVFVRKRRRRRRFRNSSSSLLWLRGSARARARARRLRVRLVHHQDPHKIELDVLIGLLARQPCARDRRGRLQPREQPGTVHVRRRQGQREALRLLAGFEPACVLPRLHEGIPASERREVGQAVALARFQPLVFRKIPEGQVRVVVVRRRRRRRTSARWASRRHRRNTVVVVSSKIRYLQVDEAAAALFHKGVPQHSDGLLHLEEHRVGGLDGTFGMRGFKG